MERREPAGVEKISRSVDGAARRSVIFRSAGSKDLFPTQGDLDKHRDFSSTIRLSLDLAGLPLAVLPEDTECPEEEEQRERNSQQPENQCFSHSGTSCSAWLTT